MAEIRFYCMYCGRKLAVDDQAAGTGVTCPECKKTIFVPDPSSSPSRNKSRVVRISTPLHEVAEPPPPKAGAGRTNLEIAVGWLCLSVALVLVLMAPRLFWVYGPLLLPPLMLSVILVLKGKIVPGVILMLCTVIAAPALACHRMAVAGRSVPPAREAAAARRLVFSADTHEAVLVPVEPAEVTAPAKPSAPRAEKRAAARRAEADFTRSVVDTRASAKMLRENGGEPAKPQAAGDLYEELLRATNEIPPLVPEDVLAATHVEPSSSDEPRFRWQGSEAGALAAPSAVVIKARLPLVVYEDCSGEERPYAPSGWMGDTDSIQVDECCEVNPHSGGACVKASYNSTHYWGGVAWQNPPNNWGAMPGGFDLTGASNLTFWARKEKDGPETVVTFKVGLKNSEPFSDTASVSSDPIKLKDEWKRYTISLKGRDLSRIISGFVWIVEAADKPLTFYLDDVRFE